MAECTRVRKESDTFFMASHTGLTQTSDKFPHPEVNKQTKKPYPRKIHFSRSSLCITVRCGVQKKVIHIFGTLPLAM